MCFNIDGMKDVGFLNGSGCQGLVKMIVLQVDGKIFVGGVFFNYNGVFVINIVWVNMDGIYDIFVLWGGMLDNVWVIIVQLDSNILINIFD